MPHHQLSAGISGAVQPVFALLISSMISMFFETAPVGVSVVAAGAALVVGYIPPAVFMQCRPWAAIQGQLT
jgi:hypothetical protein